MIDVYTLLLLRVAGTGTLAIISFIAFIQFFFAGENGTGRLFGIVMLTISLYLTMVTTTALTVINAQNLTPQMEVIYYAFWARETIAVWLANIAIIILGLYLIKR